LEAEAEEEDMCEEVHSVNYPDSSTFEATGLTRPCIIAYHHSTNSHRHAVIKSSSMPTHADGKERERKKRNLLYRYRERNLTGI
jgi:hypothetical protein